MARRGAGAANHQRHEARITHVFGSRDGRWLLYAQDRGGIKTFTSSAPIPTGKAERVDLTPFDGVERTCSTCRARAGEALIVLNQRDREVFDVIGSISNPASSRSSAEPRDVDSWSWTITAAVRRVRGKSGHRHGAERARHGDGPFRKLARFTDADDFSAHAFSKDGAFLYVTDARGSNTTRLLSGCGHGEGNRIAEDATYDWAHDDRDVTHELVAVAFERERLEYQSSTSNSPRTSPRSQGACGDVLFRSADARRRNGRRLHSPTDPGATYLYDRATGAAQVLYRPRPWLKPDQLAEMQPISYPAPTASRSAATSPRRRRGAARLAARARGAWRTWARDEWGYDGEAQWLANRGYAVLQVNYRARPATAKHSSKPHREWGGRMPSTISSTAWNGPGPGHRRPRAAGHLRRQLRRLRHALGARLRPGVFRSAWITWASESAHLHENHPPIGRRSVR